MVEKTGVAAVENFANLKGRLNDAVKIYKEIYTLLPHDDDTGYPHAAEWSRTGSSEAAPGAKLRDVTAPATGAMRQIKSPSEIALLTKAIELSVDAQLAAMRMMRPGLYEYQVAAAMVEIHSAGGCEGEAYAPIVGTGFHSTVLHFNELDAQIEDGARGAARRGRAIRRLHRRHRRARFRPMAASRTPRQRGDLRHRAGRAKRGAGGDQAGDDHRRQRTRTAWMTSPANT